MNNRRKFVLLTLFYFIITVSDLLFTYFATPDLSLEGNPLVKNLEFSWLGLIIVNVVTFVIYFILAYYAYVKYKPPVSKETDDLMRYLADITYDDPEKVVKGMWKWPQNWAPQIACLCYSVSTALPFARLVIVIEWFLIIKQIDAPLFFSIVAIFPQGRIDYFLALIIAFFLSFYWIKNEFKHNMEIQKQQ